MKTGAHILVKGLVQGVGYRYFVIRRASSLGLNGWVRNLYNGDVEVEVEGERGLIEDLLKELKHGPPMSSVRDLKINWLEFENKYSNFDARF
ncbi:acylphosphatase [candidate division KSB1 bacterium]